MLTAKVFQSGNSQAIRIPKEVRTEEQEFAIFRFGKGFLLMPTDDPWALLHHSIGRIPEEFLTDREQPMLHDLSTREEL